MEPKSPICINEAYRGYSPPVDASSIVNRLLRTVPEKYLRGLDCVVLTNAIALSRKQRVGKIWSRRRRVDKSRVRGLYHHASRNSLPYVELRVDKIIASSEKWALRIPIFRDIIFGYVLFHELGHHIHSTIRPEYTEKENVADVWAAKLNLNFMRETYWYGAPLFKTYYLLTRRKWVRLDRVPRLR
jgi:hypothetical protein